MSTRQHEYHQKAVEVHNLLAERGLTLGEALAFSAHTYYVAGILAQSKYITSAGSIAVQLIDRLDEDTLQLPLLPYGLQHKHNGNPDGSEASGNAKEHEGFDGNIQDQQSDETSVPPPSGSSPLENI